MVCESIRAYIVASLSDMDGSGSYTVPSADPNVGSVV